METVCDVCGTPTQCLHTKRCNDCWEVERRIDRYLQSKKGLSLIRRKLADLRYNWKAAAQAKVEHGMVTAEEVRQLNESAKEHIIKVVETPEEGGW